MNMKVNVNGVVYLTKFNEMSGIFIIAQCGSAVDAATLVPCLIRVWYILLLMNRYFYLWTRYIPSTIAFALARVSLDHSFYGVRKIERLVDCET